MNPIYVILISVLLLAIYCAITFYRESKRPSKYDGEIAMLQDPDYRKTHTVIKGETEDSHYNKFGIKIGGAIGGNKARRMAMQRWLDNERSSKVDLAIYFDLENPDERVISAPIGTVTIIYK